MATMFEPFEPACDPPRDDAHVAAFNNLTRTSPYHHPMMFFNWIQEKKRALNALKIKEFHRTVWENVQEVLPKEYHDAFYEEAEEVLGWESRGDSPYLSEDDQEQQKEAFFWNKKF